jgi:DNA polymerase-3 subunit alpha (Gram-positive type)
MSAIRLAWYKIYRAKEFYAAYLSVAPNGFDAAVVGGGLSAIGRRLDEIAEKEKKKEATANDGAQQSVLLLVREAILRGIRFLPIDLHKSDAVYFLPEEGGIRMPFLSLAGLGDTVAHKIVEVREAGEIFSVDELRRKAGLSKTIVEMLRSYGVFAGMQENDQLSFF